MDDPNVQAALDALPSPQDSFDAMKWAESFVAHVKLKPTIATDVGTMLAWFATALMRGYDEYPRGQAVSPLPVGSLDLTKVLSNVVLDRVWEAAVETRDGRNYVIVRRLLAEALAAAEERRAPVQGYAAGIPWSMHLRAYDFYCKQYGKQDALIEGWCRGGFSTGELDMFIPGWREELAVVPTPKWQPIATAPRNASWMLVRLPNGDVRRAHWAEDLSGSEQPAFRGWFVATSSVSYGDIPDPTHWMPEPPPPVEPT